MAGYSNKIIPIDILPGIFKNTTRVEARNRYVNGDKVRWRGGLPEKKGGFSRELTSGLIQGVARSALSWQSLTQEKLMAVGTHRGLYIYSGGQYFDITPISDTTSLTDKITTVIGQSFVKVDNPLRTVRVGDTVRFPSPVTYNGITLSGFYYVDSTESDGTVAVILTNQTASASGTGGGTFDISYTLASGLKDSGISGFGYGTGFYGLDYYGTPRTSGSFEDARVWCLQNFGEDLLALPIGGALYFWDTSAGASNRASKVATAPDVSNYMIFASRFRQVILFGTKDLLGNFDPMLIRWSDSEDYTNYTPATSNNAGEFRLTKGTKIVSAVETRSGEILVFTDSATFIMRPSNSNFVYEVELLGDGVSILGPNCCVEVEGAVYWAAPDGFRTYDGTIRIMPCTLDQFIFNQDSDGRYDENQTAKFFMSRNREYNEIDFYWQTKGQTSDPSLPEDPNFDVDRYATFNYKEGVWYDGTLRRTCWVDNSVFSLPYAFSVGLSNLPYTNTGDDQATGTFTDATTSVLFVHETGKNADGGPMEAFLETAFYDISNGQGIMFVDRVIPDGDFDGQIDLQITAIKFPNSVESSVKGYRFDQTTEQVPVRSRGRFISYKISSNQTNGDMRIGKMFVAVREDGYR